jgi:NADH dehydrogenase/NADH:ubiquinone oxidoreductase subunit G
MIAVATAAAVLAFAAVLYLELRKARKKAAFLASAVEALAAHAERLEEALLRLDVAAYVREREELRMKLREAEEALRAREAPPRDGRYLWVRSLIHTAVRPAAGYRELWVKIPVINLDEVRRAEEELARKYGAVRRWGLVREAMSKTEIVGVRPDGVKERIVVPVRPPALYLEDYRVVAWRPAPYVDAVLRYAIREESDATR